MHAIAFIVATFVVIIGLLLIAIAFQYKKVGPHEVLIITGGRTRTIKLHDGLEKRVGYRLRIGGGTFVIPFLEAYQILPLHNIPMEFAIDELIAQNGVKGVITGTAQVKINGVEPGVHLAAEQFLGRPLADVKDVALKTIEGRVRAIFGTLNLENVNKNRQEFNDRIFEEVKPAFDRMGIVLIAFNLKDIRDSTGYLEALGRPVIANAKRDAEVAQAEANRDATIKSAEARKEGDIAKLIAETEIAEATKNYELNHAEFQATINQKKAVSDYTYDLERQKMNKLIKEEEHKVKLLEKEHSISIAEKEIVHAKKDLTAKVREPAEAEKFRLLQESQAMAEAKRIQGQVEAELTQAQGTAEALAMKQKADAWKSYNQAAMIHQMFDMLPQLAREIAEPLSKIEKIVMVNSGGEKSGLPKLTGDIAEVLAQIPTVVKTLSGVDLQALLAKLPPSSDDDIQLNQEDSNK